MTLIEILSSLVLKVLGIFLNLDKNVPKTNLGIWEVTLSITFCDIELVNLANLFF
jgi:hypothetical protein